MTAVTIELPTETFAKLRAEAERSGLPVEHLAKDWITERLGPDHTDRAQLQSILRSAGLLAEPTPELLNEAAQATISLDAVSDALSRPGGKPLSEIIIEQRGPKA